MKIAKTKRNQLLEALKTAEQQIEDVQHSVDNLKELEPSLNLSDVQVKIDALNTRIMTIAPILDEPDVPYM